MVLEMYQESIAMKVMGSITIISLKEHSIKVPNHLSLYLQTSTLVQYSPYLIREISLCSRRELRHRLTTS